MEFADYMTLTSMIGVAAAEAIRGDDARISEGTGTHASGAAARRH